MMAKKYIYLGTGVLVLLLDQVTKYFTRTQNFGQWNTGGILGLGGSWNWILLVVPILLFLIWQLKNWQHLNHLEKIGWSIIIFSGVSNLLDRIFFSAVWDWIVYPVINVVANLADATLALGVLLILVAELRKSLIPKNK